MENESEKPTKSEKSAQKTTPSTKKRAGIYFVIGLTITILNFLLYSLIANLIIKNNDLIWLSTLIATFIITFLAYFLHSRITWKERLVTKTTIIKFFIWNFTIAFVVLPLITQLFSLITPLYDFAKSISDAIHLDFSFDFIQNTGAFVLSGVVIMIINFLFYDKFVFGKKDNSHEN